MKDQVGRGTVGAMVHNSKARVQALATFIMDAVIGHRTAFDVSDVKQDGTVFVKFRSYMSWSSATLSRDFNRALHGAQKKFTQTDDRTFRLALDQFG